MKKIKQLLTISILSIFMLSTVVAETHPKNENSENSVVLEKDNLPIDINIVIDWGRVSKECKGFGICKITFEIDLDLLDLISKAFGLVRPTDDGGLNVFFPKDGQSEYSLRTYLGDDYVLIGEDYVLEDEVASKLGLREGFTIKAGKYLLEESKNGYSVKF